MRWHVARLPGALVDTLLKVLLEALTNKNFTLTSLDISDNELGDEGIKYLCKAW